MTDVKFRVSAKQRLELVKQAWQNFKDAIEPDIDKLEWDLEEAINGRLEPKRAAVDSASPADPEA